MAWNKSIKKTVYTLNLNPDVYKPITDLTYPFIKNYCRKIGADFHVINERKFPTWQSPTYEKCQVYQLAQEHGNDWNIFIDADALVHPDTPDITTLIPKDTVLHYASDFANCRWKSDRFFARDGRNIGSPSWLCVASDQCIELFKPLDDLTEAEAAANIFPVANELNNGYEPWRLIEDYVFSRNIAKYGLKFKSFADLMNEDLRMAGNFFWHDYMKSIEEKVKQMNDTLRSWNLI